MVQGERGMFANYYGVVLETWRGFTDDVSIGTGLTDSTMMHPTHKNWAIQRKDNRTSSSLLH